VLQFKEPFYTVKEAAIRLGVSPGRVHQLVLERRIPAIKIARDLLISQSAIEQYQRIRRPYRKSQ